MRYYFHLDPNSKGLKQGYVMEDKEHHLIYEAIMTKNSIFKPCMYDFINHLSGSIKTYAMGHPIQKSEGIANVGNVRIAQIYDSHFKLDGVNNWEYFESRGYKTDIKPHKLGEIVDLSKDGVTVVHLESAGRNLFEDDPKGDTGLLNSIHTSGCYRVDCSEEDLDIAFLLCFSLTRTDV